MFAGSLNINGQSHEAGLRTQGRLSVKGASAMEVAETAEAAVPAPQPEDSGQSQGGGVKENFANNLLANLYKNTEEGSASAQEFAGSVSAAVDELKKQFGNGAANQAMAEILRATPSDTITADKIAGAFTNVLQGLAQKNTAALANENLAGSDFDAVLKSQKNLDEFRKFLNDGAAADPSTPSLNTALNDYFPSADFNSFNEDFTWGSQAPPATEGDSWGSPFWVSPEITIDGIGRENLADFINFLRTDLDSEEEAQYFETLAGSADFLTEIEQLSDRFYFSDPEVEMGMGLNGWAKDISIMGRNGPGTEKAEKLGQYAEYELTDLINKTIQENPNLRNRVVNELPPSLTEEAWEFSGWRLTGSRAATLMENHSGGQPNWNFKNFEGSRCERRDNGEVARGFAEAEMKKRGMWKDEYSGYQGTAEQLFLQSMFDRGQYDGLDTNGSAFKSKQVREREYLNSLTNGNCGYTKTEIDRFYREFQNVNSGLLIDSNGKVLVDCVI